MKLTCCLLTGMLLAGMIISSCKHEPVTETVPPGPGPVVIDTLPQRDTICFSNDVLPVMISNCAVSGCHDAATHEEDYDLTTYAGVMKGIKAGNPDKSDLIKEIKKGKMPPAGYSPIPQEQLDRIVKWVAQGALNSSCNTCDTTNVTFSGSVWPIINTNCKGCHAVTQPSLNTYADVKAQAKSGKLYCVISWGSGCRPMPDGATKLPACSIRTIKKWIDAGMPNN